jgi:hypothetical protein
MSTLTLYTLERARYLLLREQSWSRVPGAVDAATGVAIDPARFDIAAPRWGKGQKPRAVHMCVSRPRPVGYAFGLAGALIHVAEGEDQPWKTMRVIAKVLQSAYPGHLTNLKDFKPTEPEPAERILWAFNAHPKTVHRDVIRVLEISMDEWRAAA